MALGLWPWGYGPSLAAHAALGTHTQLTVWLLRLGIAVSHGRIRHPQTQGKEERLQRTLGEELLDRRTFADRAACQAAFDSWRFCYNHERPQQALGMQLPAAHYHPSLRPYPEQRPPVVYDEGASVRISAAAGRLYFANRRFRVGKAFRGEAVAVLPTATDGRFQVVYATFPIYALDLKDPHQAGRRVDPDTAADVSPMSQCICNPISLCHTWRREFSKLILIPTHGFSGRPNKPPSMNARN